MDRNEEDMKHIGFFGIFKQSFTPIFTYTKIFTQITLTFILPLTLIFLAHTTISNRFFSRIENSYINYDYSHITVSDWLYYWLFKITYFTFLIVFSLLATAAIVFTIASVYVDHDVVFRQVLKIVPRIWKQLVVTFVFIYLAMFLYNIICGGIIFLIIRVVYGYLALGFGLVVTFILLGLYVYGFLYLSVVWQLASVVTVLENNRGFEAMRKGKDLLYGKKKSGMGIAFVLYGFLVGFILVYMLFVQYGDDIFELTMIWRVIIGISCCLVLMIVFLLFIVTQTVLYLVCKSYHREGIDKLSLSMFLGSYMGETVVYPKLGEEIQLGNAQPQTLAQEV